ncbi:DR3 [Human betaherpesvirus 6A]|uniref:DR3 n=1 Tax=Human betaherpesvirus 6A TaxID=32603 RepID=W8FQR8_9BETA|nr:DR3 [Human betaherpesvirus 6A]AHK06942.1 DR3 [Human betaherpesvirus 6A]
MSGVFSCVLRACACAGLCCWVCMGAICGDCQRWWRRRCARWGRVGPRVRSGDGARWVSRTCETERAPSAARSPACSPHFVLVSSSSSSSCSSACSSRPLSSPPSPRAASHAVCAAGGCDLPTHGADGDSDEGADGTVSKRAGADEGAGGNVAGCPEDTRGFARSPGDLMGGMNGDLGDEGETGEGGDNGEGQ